MTPLAQRYFKALTRPVAKRPPDPEGRLRAYEDLHCFEVSSLIPSIGKCLTGHKPHEILRDLPGPFFLPAPATWIEFDSDDVRCGALLRREANRIEISVCLDNPKRCPRRVTPLNLIGTFLPPDETCQSWAVLEDGLQTIYLAVLILTLVDVINTPGIVHISPREPHIGFARSLAATGHYPLNAWHEVVINPTAVRTAGGAHSGGLRPLHFVRAHRRRCWSKDNVVIRSHWKGDPAVGIERTRYRVEAAS